jgi:hypothetical protein
MSTADQALAAVILACLFITAGFFIAYRLGYSDGWHAGRASEHARQSHRRLRENRAAAAVPASPRDGGAPPWYVPVAPRRIVTDGRGGPAITAYGASRVPMRPQPGRTSGAGTVQFRAVSSTGEFRALAARGTDDYIERLEAEGDIYRAQLREAMAT